MNATFIVAVLCYAAEGQFLPRSSPVTTGIVPANDYQEAASIRVDPALFARNGPSAATVAPEDAGRGVEGGQ